jgi:hypothetical protein
VKGSLYLLRSFIPERLRCSQIFADPAKKRPELFNQPVYNHADLDFYLKSKFCEKDVGAAAQ